MHPPNHSVSREASILVTGGTGFLGSYLLRYLLAYGYTNIRALCRPTSDFALLDGVRDRIDWVEADILDFMDVQEAVSGADRVFHCAAFISFHRGEKRRMIRANREGTANVVNACLYGGVKKMIHSSSIAALGRGKREKTVTEETKWENNPNNSDYAVSKFLAEQEVWRGFEEGLDMAIVNPSLILGSGNWVGFNTQRIFRLGLQGFPFYATGATGLVDVRDVARMMIHLSESPISGERFICNSANWSYRKLSSQIAEELGKKPPAIPFGPVLRAIAPPLIGIQSRITGRTPSVTRQTAHLTSLDYAFDNGKSLKVLNWHYIPPELTIKQTAAQLMEAGKDSWKPGVLELY